MTDYILLTAPAASDLAEMVKDHLLAGYSLYGSPGAIVGVSGGHTYWQAVAK